MRYTSWFRRSGATDAPSGAVNLGKKLLGYLSNQRRLGASETQVIRRVMEDGTLVVASFIGGIPKVAIYPAGTELQPPACELYVESGLLDLGPNIAPDANERFNRGLPEFDDSPALLYFGDDVTCDDKLNGKVQIAPGRVRSQCLGQAGDAPVESRLKDPAKKKAQAVLPASCWSGLMHRYVQAIYGGNAVSYRLKGGGLELGTGDSAVTVSPWAGNTWGLLLLESRLFFACVTEDNIEVRQARLSACGEYVLSLWSNLPTSTEVDKIKAEKVLTIALSTCTPGKVLNVIPHGMPGAFITGYGPAFETDRFATIRLDATGHTSLFEARFSLVGNSVSVDVTELERSEASPGVWAANVTRAGVNASSNVAVVGPAESLTPSSTYDFPVNAWYSDGQLSIVRYYVESEQEEQVLDATQCQFPYATPAGGGCPKNTLARVYPRGLSTVSVSSGFYVTTGSGTVWSDVLLNTAVAVGDGAKSIVKQVDDVRVEQVLADPVEVVTGGNTSSSSDAIYVGFVGWYAPSEGGIHHLYSANVCNGSIEPTAGEPAGCFESSDPLIYYIDEPVDPDGNGGLSAVDVSETAEFVISKSAFFALSQRGLSYIPNPAAQDHTAYYNGRSEYAIEMYGARSSAAFLSYSFRGARGWVSVGQQSTHDTVLGAGASITKIDVTVTSDITGAQQSYSTGPIPTDLIPKTNRLSIRAHGGEPHYVDISSQPLVVIPGSMGGVTTFSNPYQGWGPAGQANPANKTDLFYGREALTSSMVVDSTVESPYSGVGSVLLEHGGSPWASGVPVTGDAEAVLPGVTSPPEVDEHIEVEFGSNDEYKAISSLYVGGEEFVCQGFQYRGSKSLLGAVTRPESTAVFGASVSMDRESISGGYPKVQWPSFVGWA